MLEIKNKHEGWVSWWLGCGIPDVANGRVVTFQADGDELNLFLQAMHATVHPINGVAYTKQKGFQRYPEEGYPKIRIIDANPPTDTRGYSHESLSDQLEDNGTVKIEPVTITKKTKHTNKADRMNISTIAAGVVKD